MGGLEGMAGFGGKGRREVKYQIRANDRNGSNERQDKGVVLRVKNWEICCIKLHDAQYWVPGLWSYMIWSEIHTQNKTAL